MVKFFENYFETNEEKTFKCLQRLYDDWQQKKVWENWPGTLQDLQDSIGSERRDLYLFAVGQLLALAAREDDRDAFIWLLERGEYPWFSMQSFRGISYMTGGMFEAFSKKFPWLSNELFITEKEEYLDEIFRRYGISRVADEVHEVMVDKDRKAVDRGRVTLPDPYIAIISGNLHMAEYFRERGGYGRWGYIADDLELFASGLAYFSDRFPQGAPLKDMWGDPLFDQKDKVDPDVLMIALLSRSFEMTEWVLEHFKDIPWGEPLARSIMWTDRRTTEMIWRSHPELPGFFSAEDIMESRNMILLKAFLEECIRTGRDAESEFLAAEMQEREKSWPRDGAAPFYQYAFPKFRSREVKRKIHRAMFAEPDFLRNRKMQQMFWKYGDVAEDYTDYLDVHLGLHTFRWGIPNGKLEHQDYYPVGYDILCRLCERGESGRFPVDVYRISEELCACVSDKELERMLEAFQPVRLENRVDVLTRELLRRGSKRFLKKAAQQGFVTSMNAPALLAEAGRLQCRQEIRIMLMEESYGKPLAERYRQRGDEGL